MVLYVMRHGPAQDRAPTGRDFDRALTPVGREVVARAARAFHAEGDRTGPWRVLSSPYVRARQTAEIVAAAAPPGRLAQVEVRVEIREDLAAEGGTPLRLVDELASAGTDALLVGHQPTMEDLACALIHPVRLPLPGGFRTAAIVALERVALDDAAGWRPTWVCDPHVLAG